MIIFDYTDGVKGKELGSSPVPIAAGPARVEKNGRKFHIYVKGHDGEWLTDGGSVWTWHTDYIVKSFTDDGEFDGEKLIDPRDFGVEAICFCVGHVESGMWDFWDWNVLGTDEWNKEAFLEGILKAEVVS